MADLNRLQSEAQEIQEFLEITMSDNPQEVIERGNDLQVYMARTGKMLADANIETDVVSPKLLPDYRKQDVTRL